MRRDPIKIFIASIRPIGKKCEEYAKNNLPQNCAIAKNLEDADVIFSIIYDKIFSDNFLKDRRCYNFHCGILPCYGGSNSSSWSIINKEDEHGITLHEIDTGLDTGPIIDIKKLSIRPDETALSLYTRGEKVIFEMFQEWFERIILNDYDVTNQLESVKLYSKKRFERIKDISHLVRAFYFPGKENLYFYNSFGEKIYVSYDMRQGDFKNE